MKTSISLPEDLVLKSKHYAYTKGYTFSGLIRVLLEKELSREVGHNE